MSTKSTLPLKIDHKSYIKTLSGEGKYHAWKQFSDAFWNSETLRAGSRSEFLFRRGFLRDKWVIYGFDDNDPEYFLSDFQAAQINQANGIYANVLQDRMLLCHTLAGYCTVPEIHALRGLDAEEVSLTQAWSAHRTAKEAPSLDIMIQPLLAGPRGKSATVSVNKGKFEGFGKSGDMTLLSNIVRDWSQASRVPYLFTDNLKQGAFMEGLYPHTQNRLSVIIGRDLDSWDPVLIAATLRIGTSTTSGNLDLVQGGLSAVVNAETGELGQVAQVDADMGLGFIESHPETGIVITGQVIPNWEEIRLELLRIMDESSYMRIALLDFTIMEDGRLGLLGPSQLDLSAVQVHQPLLRQKVFAETMRKLTL
ncbi:sugar-transfer associated ATP-grasp domain-containing protein [Lutimaribacter marinistellae]|uniref:Sugar-transfer associated ATP-grasp domain-containing protein n=1 Tax=Lutimaribacter marinistellae TaxID=1820329 RepID=A0ABV7TB71_9RHOB